MHQATLLLYDEISSTYVECNLIAGAESGTPKDSESGAEVSLVLVWDATASWVATPTVDAKIGAKSTQGHQRLREVWAIGA
jgi:hypothetical protein